MTTLIFLPGHMCDERAWAPVANSLAGRGHDCRHVNLAQDDVDLMARHALAQCSGPVVPVGFSMGAIVALAMARAAPDRIEGLCLVGINASDDLPDRAQARLLHQQMAREGRLDEILRDIFIPNYFSAEKAHDAALRQLCIDMAATIGAETFRCQSEALRTRPDGRPGLAAIACPTLVIGGDEDKICPPDWHRETAASIPGATLEIMPGGHMALIERPDDMAARIGRWLAGRKGETVHG